MQNYNFFWNKLHNLLKNAQKGYADYNAYPTRTNNLLLK